MGPRAAADLNLVLLMSLFVTFAIILFQLTAEAQLPAAHSRQSCGKVLSVSPGISVPTDIVRKSTSKRAALRQLETKKTAYFLAPSGRELAYDFIPPQRPDLPTLVSIHGLGDSRQRLQPFATRALQDGLGLLRMDLNGHGETLKQALAKGKMLRSQDHHYDSNIEDILALIIHSGIKKIILAGHSYGGGLSLKLGDRVALNQVTHGLELQLIVMLAPYVQRIDKYWENVAMNPFQSTLGSWSDVPRGYQEFLMNLFGTQQIRDFFQDPVSDPVFHNQFRQYFTQRMESEVQRPLTLEESEWVEYQSNTANMTMKEARGLDYLNPLIPLPSVDAPIILVGSLYDEIVPSSQLQQFDLRLKNEQKSVMFKLLKENHFGHFFPQTHGEMIYDQTIGEFLQSLRSRN